MLRDSARQASCLQPSGSGRQVNSGSCSAARWLVFKFDDKDFADSVRRLEDGEPTISQSRALLLSLVEQIVNGDMEPARKLASIEKAIISDLRLKVQERKDDLEAGRLIPAEGVRSICAAVTGTLMDQMKDEMDAGTLSAEGYERIVDQFKDRFVANIRGDANMCRLFNIQKQIEHQ